MKQYEVTLTGHFEKTVSIYADSPEQAAEKLKIILVPTVRASAPCAENVCMRAKIKDTSYQALNLVIHLPMETKFAC